MSYFSYSKTAVHFFFYWESHFFFLSACINSFYIKKYSHLSVMFVKRVFHRLVITLILFGVIFMYRSCSLFLFKYSQIY